MLVWENRPFRLVDLAAELNLSQSEISLALERAKNSGLVDSSKRKPLATALAEFLIHGLKYAFPAKRGSLERGMPTAHSAPPLVERIVSENHDQYIWPTPEGNSRGQSVTPLYPSAPEAARKDPKLYEWLALLDALRLGRARERKLAIQEIEKRLGPHGDSR
jgi:DNA-binding transcriptional MocR family regulator